MKTYCITFGQSHPLRDHWIEVRAEDEAKARSLVASIFGLRWSCIYLKEDFQDEYYPGGRVGYTIS